MAKCTGPGGGGEGTPKKKGGPTKKGTPPKKGK